MDRVVLWTAGERGDLFEQTAAEKGLSEVAVVEKDFWVCWALKHIFGLANRPTLVLRGGTSLSKVYDLIERFSEDVDLSIDRRDLGLTDDHDPRTAQSRNEAKRRSDHVRDECARYIESALLPLLERDFAIALGDPTNGSWALTLDEQDQDRETILFRYPPSRVTQELQEASYLQPVVRLELGARGDVWPSKQHRITPYAAEVFREQFAEPLCEVVTIEARRTFWEKTTLLHEEYHRPTVKVGDRLSRHYYDVVMLARSPIAEQALHDLDLLREVVEQKNAYFYSRRAKFREAVAGRLRLVPHEQLNKALRADYEKMRMMIFAEPPSFADLLGELQVLENKINQCSSAAND